MSILDKHPAPWRRDEQSIVRDANGNTIEFCEELERLGLAAPELLAALKRNVKAWADEGYKVEITNAEDVALIKRIEKTS